MNNETYLVVTAIGQHRSALANSISKIAAGCGCSIVNCHMCSMGSVCTAMIMLVGTWNAVAKMESQLQLVQKKEKIQLQMTRTELPEYTEKLLPYIVSGIAPETPDLMHRITHFFTEQNINISDLMANTYLARQTGARMFNLTMVVEAPASTQIADLRENFLLLSEELNLDALIELEKN